jgi:uncharacterized membrane protein
MQTKTHLLGFGLLLVIVQAACGPSPAFEAGPVLDPIVSVILVGALILGGYWVVKSVGSSPAAQAITKGIAATEERVRGCAYEPMKPENPSLTAEQILRERYARGEIDQEQYHEMMKGPEREVITDAPIALPQVLTVG